MDSQSITYGAAAIGAVGALSQPLTKLIETMSGGLGTMYRPVGRVLDAGADIVIDRMHESAEVSRQRRAAARLAQTELRRQENIDATVAEAARRLPHQVSATPVDRDWTAAFTEAIKDVSDDTLRELWARILAGEVTQPGRFSRRTVALLSTFSRSDAELVLRFTGVTIANRRYESADVAACFLDGHENYYNSATAPFSISDLLRLVEFGMLDPSTRLLSLYREPFKFVTGDRMVVQTNFTTGVQRSVPIFRATRALAEISAVADPAYTAFSEANLKLLIEFLGNFGIACEVRPRESGTTSSNENPT